MVLKKGRRLGLRGRVTNAGVGSSSEGDTSPSPNKFESKAVFVEDSLRSTPSSDLDNGLLDDDAIFRVDTAEDAIEAVCSNREKNTRGMGQSNNYGQGSGAVDSPTTSGSPTQAHDMEDTEFEVKKHDQPAEGSGKKSKTSLDDWDEKINESNQLAESDEMRDPPVPAPPEDDVGVSDVEEDVKVCDICGDAGREDLLAVCNRCSDGAEHTYCMREMLDEVPEGEWLCEECKSSEVLQAHKKEHPKRTVSDVRSKILGRTRSLHSNLSPKLDNRDSSCEFNKLKSVSLNKQASSERTVERLEPGSTTKCLALPKSPSPSQIRVFSKGTSFKNLDTAKGKPSNQISTGESSDNALSPSTNSIHAPKGNFVKSNSFSSSNSKLNVKDSEDIAQNQNQFVDVNDGSGKLMGKSMSFKGLGRSSGNEPKVKMLSMKCAPISEVKGQKHGRDRDSFERKKTMKLDHAFPAQTATNPSKRFSRGTDGNSTFSLTNSHDFKNVQIDMGNLQKNAGHVVPKSSDSPANLGELKRPSCSSIVGSTSANGTADPAEIRLNNSSVKDGLSYSRTVDRSISADGARVDGQVSQSEKAPDNSFGCSRQGPNGRVLSGRPLCSLTSALKAKEHSHEENKLKAAIEAAMQKKQDIFKKNKVPEKLNDLSMSNAQVKNVGDAVANKARDSISDEAMCEGDSGLRESTVSSCKSISISASNQFQVYPDDFGNAPAEESVLAVSAIPEQESVWQGGFEIHRNGKLREMCGGFQAHKSNIASGQVLEVVRKLPQKIVFSEVHRSCAWPVHFKEFGAQEDHIALYFFAKDIESYVRSYKILVEYMIKHDLALRGKINGVDLLVFPSNHLPNKSQCWNALFFMWGVLRASRQRCPDERIGSLRKSESSIFSTVLVDKDVCITESLRFHKPAVEDLSVSGSGRTVVSLHETPTPAGSSLQRVAILSNGVPQTDECATGRSYSNVPISPENLEKRPRNYSVMFRESCPESQSATLKDCSQLNLNTIVEDQKSVGQIDTSKNVADKKTLSSQDRQHSSSFPSEVSTLESKRECENVIHPEEQQRLDMRANNSDNVELEKSLKLEEQCADKIQNRGPVRFENDLEHKEGTHYMPKNDRARLKSGGDLGLEGCSRSCDAENVDSLKYSPERHSQEGSLESVSPAASMIKCLKRPWLDREDEDTSEDGNQICTNKRVKGTESWIGCNLYEHPSFGDRLGVQISGVSCSSHKEDTSNEAGIHKSTFLDPGLAEGCFFPVNSHVSQSILTEDGSMHRKLTLLENEDRLPDVSPNLELALGLKRMQSREGVFPFFDGIVDGKDPVRPLDIASSKEADKDAGASLSLSLAFPF